MDSGITIHHLETILTLLTQFNTANHHYLNLVKVATALKLSQKEMDEILDFIFRFQEIFSAILPEKRLSKIIKEGVWYLTCSSNSQNDICTELQLTSIECKILSDIVYYFQHIAKGKGFDIRFPNTDLLKNIKGLKKSHPIFFENKGNGLIYPTSIALSLGKMLETYNRTNRTVSTLICENYRITII